MGSYEILDRLRSKAEELIGSTDNPAKPLDAAEVQKLFHEVQIYQLELEMQNDEMSIVAEELEKEKSRFLNLFEMAPVGYLVLNNRGIITDINNAGVKLLGLGKYQIISRPLAGFVHHDDVHAFRTFYTCILDFNEAFGCQLKMFKAGTKVFYAQLNGKGTNINSLEASYYITLIDVTEKRNNELKIKESKKHLELALDASSTGIWGIEMPAGKIFMDNFSCSIIGLKPGAFDGRLETLLSHINPEDRDKVDAALRTTMIREKPFNVEFGIRNATGRNRYVMARGQVVYNEFSRRFIGTVTDITQKKELEQEAIRLNETQQMLMTAAALKAEENEKKRISEALHDSVGQMLYAIKINFQQLSTDKGNPAYENAAKLIDQTIRDVRNISFELAPSILLDFGIAPTLEEMAKRLSNAQLTIQTKVTGVANKLGNEFFLNIFRIIQELVNNCIKHADGSKINVELSCQTNVITIQVKDNGKGFKHEYGVGPITGTGLSSIKNRINLYEGLMNIHSNANEGTLVTIALKTPVA